jgi:outer membrane receptor protein involved in Fe transport
MSRLARTLLAIALVALALPAPSQAQDSYEVSGIVTDSTGAPLERTMVVALALPDSTLTAFATSDGEGAFTLRRVPPGDYLLQLQLTSFATVRTPFSVVDRDIRLEPSVLTVQPYLLDPLVVSVDHVPFRIRGDTLSYNAVAFEVRPNASVEDLLRRLPGFEIDADGTIKVQGEVVEQVLVEGREFFGTDPTVATRGLPADAVQRVEVFDKESDMAEFTGIPDGNERLTLNLLLTDAAQQGTFGEAQTALGASDEVASELSLADQTVRYDQQLGLYRFSPVTQLALIGSLNNVSRARFSIGGIGATGGAGGGGRAGGGGARGGGESLPAAGAGGGGFTRSGVIGLNGSVQFSDDDWIRSSYFLSDLATEQESDRLQQLLLGSTVASSVSEEGTNLIDRQAHRFDLNAQRHFSAGSILRLRAGLDIDGSATTDATIRSTTNLDGTLVNAETSNTTTESDALAATAAVTWMKRLDDSGRSLIVNLGANLSRPESDGLLSSFIEVPRGNDVSITEILQSRNESGQVFSNTQRVALTQPLGAGRTLEIFGLRREVREDENRDVFDTSGATPVLVPDLTSGLDQSYGYYRGGVRWNRNTDASRLVLGLEAQRSNLTGTIEGRSESIESSYSHILPSADLRLQLGQSHNVSLGYATSTREPSMEELQPFADNSSPTNVYIGNPDLRPEFSHAVNTDWRYFDAFTFLNVFSFARVSRTADDIVTSRTIDDRGFQTVQPVNGGTTWSTAAGVNIGRPVHPLGVSLSAEYQVNLAKRPEFVNGDENRSQILGNTVSFQVQNRDKARFDLVVDARFDFNDVSYSLNDELDQSYLNTSWGLKGTVYLDADWTVGGDWRLQQYDPEVFADAQNLSLLNLSISRYILDQRGSVELTAVDIMNESEVVNITTSATAISETRTQALGRYVMLRFNYRLGDLIGRGRR